MKVKPSDSYKKIDTHSERSYVFQNGIIVREILSSQKDDLEDTPYSKHNRLLASIQIYTETVIVDKLINYRRINEYWIILSGAHIFFAYLFEITFYTNILIFFATLITYSLAIIVIFTHNIIQIEYWRREKDRKLMLSNFLKEIKKLQVLTDEIIGFKQGKKSISNYLPLIQDFSKKIKMVEKMKDFLNHNIKASNAEKFFRNPIDLTPVNLVFDEWIIELQSQVSNALKSNLLLMQKEVAEYTNSVRELNTIDSALIGAKEAQIVRLMEVSRSFETAQGVVSVTV